MEENYSFWYGIWIEKKIHIEEIIGHSFFMNEQNCCKEFDNFCLRVLPHGDK